MKKKYIVPESKLFAINMKENIAASIMGGSEISGAAVIQFSSSKDGCRDYYTGLKEFEVKTNGTSFSDYYKELYAYGSEAYYTCFKYIF